MARVQLDDGPVVTTNTVSDPHFFQSSVVLHPTTPFLLDPSQLAKSTQVLLDAIGFYDRQKVTGYFWAMPSNLPVHTITTVDGPKQFFLRVEDSWIHRGKSFDSGASTLVTTTAGLPPPSQGAIYALQYTVTVAENQFAVDMLTIDPCYMHRSDGMANIGAVFRVIDMYGNEHAYRVDPSSDHSTMVISPATLPIDIGS